MKKKIAATIIFVIVLVFPMVFWPFLNYIDHTDIDENRELAVYPTTFDKDYFVNFDKYFQDHLPLRNISVKLYVEMEKKLKIAYDKILDKFYDEHFVEINNVVFGENDWLFYNGDSGLDYYRGSNLLSDDEMQKYVERAEIVNEYFKSRGKQFVIMIAPNKEQIYGEYMPEVRISSAVKRLDRLTNYFEENSDVTFVYPKQALIDGKKDYQVYYKQDTHWNSAGAYIGTMELLKALKIPVGEAEITSQTVKRTGDLANMVLQPVVEDFRYTCIYRNEIKGSNTFENDIYICKTDNANEKRMVLLGDSFRESMVDIISKEFSESMLSHRRTFNAENNYFKEEIDNADVIIFQAVERYDYQIFNENGLLDAFIKAYNLR